jgi:carbonic anhydrase
MSQYDHVTAANAAYAEAFEKGGKPLPPAKQAAVLTCMDARIIPAEALGYDIGDVHVIRNAGGRASDDAIRSLVISHKLLGTKEFFVIHHTDCGMALFDQDTMERLLASSLNTAAPGPDGWSDPGGEDGSDAGKEIDWLTFKDAADAVIEDVKRVRDHPLVPARIPIYGFMYDVDTGRLTEIEAASAAGKAG